MTATAQANGHTRAQRPNVRRNGDFANSEAWGNVYEAAAYEEQIREEADAIWEKARSESLTTKLLAKLYPLLRRPIHPGHIIATSAGKGKPYESDGVRSVQVLIDRMNNVLRPWNWDDSCEYHENGALAEVTVVVKGAGDRVLVSKSSWGGVNQANTLGNLRKGSYTNAAKLAFARFGPGHEVYTQAIDYDPDLLPGALDDQNQAPAIGRGEDMSARPHAPQPAAAGAPPVEDLEQILLTTLAIEDDLTAARRKVNVDMQNAGVGIDQRARELRKAGEGGADGIAELQRRVDGLLRGQGKEPTA